MKPKKREQSPIERLHDDYRIKTKESEEDEWIRLQRTGGGAET
mgnify:FL=1